MGPLLQTFFTQGLGLTKQPLSHEGEEMGALEVHPPPSQWLSLERMSFPLTIQWPELWPHSRGWESAYLPHAWKAVTETHAQQQWRWPQPPGPARPSPWLLCNSVWALAMVASLLFLQHPGS